MPELPEVEAARRLIQSSCVGRKIEKCIAADDDKVFVAGCGPRLVEVLAGRTLAGACRKGKYLWLQLDEGEGGGGGPWPVLHFGMTGGIVVKGVGASKYKRMHLESDPEEWPPKYTKLELDLSGGGKLAFVDSRRFARVWLVDAPPPSCEPIAKLGFDVLDQLPSAEDFAAAVRRRCAKAAAMRIKALLLEQEFCSGIGNWVGDEVLYMARVHPEAPARDLTDQQLAAVHKAIVDVVTCAVEVEADSARFPKEWLFHYRWTGKKASKDAHGNHIEFVTVGSRTSAFVPALQKLQGGAGGGAGEAGKGGGKAGTKRTSRGKAKKEEEEDEEEDEDGESADEEEKPAARGRKKAGEKPAAAKAAGAAKAKAAAKPKTKAATSSKGKKKAGSSDDDGDDSGEEEEGGEAGEEVEEAAPPPAKRPRKAAAATAAKGKGTASARAGKKGKAESGKEEGEDGREDVGEGLDGAEQSEDGESDGGGVELEPAKGKGRGKKAPAAKKAPASKKAQAAKGNGAAGTGSAKGRGKRTAA